MTIFKTKDAKNAFYIGALCVISYLICYFGRNLLSVATPYMIEEGYYDIEYIGLLSTVSMITYAGGQFVNGIIGERIRAKYMVGFGLGIAGICYLIMVFSDMRFLITVVYGLSGFFLSMLNPSLMKVIAENTRSIYTFWCSLGFSIAGFFGAPIAGMLAIIFHWEIVFVICGLSLVFTGICSFFYFHIYEKKGIISYKQKQKVAEKGDGIKALLRHSIIKFSFVALLTGIVRTSVVFWIPTYLSQYLKLSTTSATTIFTVMTLAQSAAPYINMVLIYGTLLKRDMNRMLLVMFSSSAISFVIMYMVPNAVINILFLFIAVIGASGASSVIWNAYCPSLKDTGMVSSATGYLDFLSYAAAALANQLFANAVSDIGWGNLIIVWGALMLVGVFVAVPIRKKGA